MTPHETDDDRRSPGAAPPRSFPGSPSTLALRNDFEQHQRRVEYAVGEKNSASGTVIEEKLWPSAPLIVAATSVIPASVISSET